MKIIKFKDGTYGIKRGWWIFSEYYSMTGENHWWQENRNINEYAKTKSLETCEFLYNILLQRENTTIEYEVIDLEKEKAKIRAGIK